MKTFVQNKQMVIVFDKNRDREWDHYASWSYMKTENQILVFNRLQRFKWLAFTIIISDKKCPWVLTTFLKKKIMWLVISNKNSKIISSKNWMKDCNSDCHYHNLNWIVRRIAASKCLFRVSRAVDRSRL